MLYSFMWSVYVQGGKYTYKLSCGTLVISLIGCIV